MIFILGGSGYLGSRVRQRLDILQIPYVYSGRSVLFDSKNNILSDNLYGDLSDSYSKSFRILKDATSLLFLSAQNDVGIVERDNMECVCASFLSLVRVRDFLHKIGQQKQLIFISTATVYDSEIVGELSEKSSVSPSNSYEMHKILCEQYVMMSKPQFLPIVLRLSNLYGPSPCPERSSGRGVFNAFIKKAFSGESIVIFSPGNWRRDFVFIDDVVEALLGLVKSPGVTGLFNLGSGVGVRFTDAAEELINVTCRILGQKVQYSIKNAEKPLERSDVRDQFLSIDEIGEAIDWRPSVSLGQGIEKSLLFLRGG